MYVCRKRKYQPEERQRRPEQLQPDRQSLANRLKPDLRTRLGHRNKRHKAFSHVSPLLRQKQTAYDDVISRDGSVSPDLSKLRKYEKITIQVDRDDY